MSEHQAACYQLMNQRSILKAEYRMYRNMLTTSNKGDGRYWEIGRMMENLHKDISRMTKIIKGK
ncbi:MAG: hypothetical protein P4L67_04515 [Candidatus Pacebacteria bacterium]|nr:hypothetical protein [Candidatus Paceibacterota bacterium]